MILKDISGIERNTELVFAIEASIIFKDGKCSQWFYWKGYKTICAVIQAIKDHRYNASKYSPSWRYRIVHQYYNFNK